MTDLLAHLETLKRPRLLINAARIGAAQYRRDMHLARHLDHGTAPGHRAALAQLIGLEAELDAARRARQADYAVARHLDVLIALMGEARLLRAETADPATAPAQAAEPAPVG
ncbi:DUF6477 family protein [Roseovarius sp. B08]|uniref:DUF6477 family protein n=1 Tax=Roseovarius sp. B08 TaxID=3449223 RepID=UPI003EDBE60D